MKRFKYKSKLCFARLITVAILGIVTGISSASSIDFETYPDGSATSKDRQVSTEYSSLGVVFSAGGAGGGIGPAHFKLGSEVGLPGIASPPNMFIHSTHSPTLNYNVFATFSIPVFMVSADVIFYPTRGSAAMVARDALNNILDTVIIPPNPTSFVSGRFSISSNTMIASVEWNGPTSIAMGIDNLNFNVPEPATIGLIILGLICLGWQQRGKAQLRYSAYCAELIKRAKSINAGYSISIHPPNPPFQPTRVDVWRVRSGFLRAGG